jgi:hypothetical protein
MLRAGFAASFGHRSNGPRAVTYYRAYLIGRDGQFMKAVDLVCDDDDDATKCARKMVDGHDVELWQQNRRVAKFEGKPG